MSERRSMAQDFADMCVASEREVETLIRRGEQLLNAAIRVQDNHPTETTSKATGPGMKGEA